MSCRRVLNFISYFSFANSRRPTQFSLMLGRRFAFYSDSTRPGKTHPSNLRISYSKLKQFRTSQLFLLPSTFICIRARILLFSLLPTPNIITSNQLSPEFWAIVSPPFHASDTTNFIRREEVDSVGES